MILRAVLVGGAEWLPLLEPTGDRVWLCRTACCTRYGWLGVPCAELDLLVEDGVAPPDLDVIEVGRKHGHYDGAERTRITIRRRHPGMGLERAVALRWDLPDAGLTLSAVDVVRRDVLWSASYRRLDTSVAPDDLGRIVQWHARRYYRMCGPDEVASATSELEAAAPATITAANRIASRALYSQAVALGWRKLSLREQERWGLTGQWHSEATLVAARSRLGRADQTVGDWTLEAAAGPEAMTLRARSWRADDEAEEDAP